MPSTRYHAWEPLPFLLHKATGAKCGGLKMVVSEPKRKQPSPNAGTLRFCHFGKVSLLRTRAARQLLHAIQSHSYDHPSISTRFIFLRHGLPAPPGRGVAFSHRGRLGVSSSVHFSSHRNLRRGTRNLPQKSTTWRESHGEQSGRL